MQAYGLKDSQKVKTSALPLPVTVRYILLLHKQLLNHLQESCEIIQHLAVCTYVLIVAPGTRRTLTPSTYGCLDGGPGVALSNEKSMLTCPRNGHVTLTRRDQCIHKIKSNRSISGPIFPYIVHFIGIHEKTFLSQCL